MSPSLPSSRLNYQKGSGMTDLKKMTDLKNVNEDSRTKLSRRRVVAGTAWAVPVVMGVGAAPAMAFTSGAPATVGIYGKLITFAFTITNFAPSDSVTISSVKLVAWPNSNFLWKNSPAPTITTNGTSKTFTFSWEAALIGAGLNWRATFSALTHTGPGSLQTSIVFSY